MNEKFLQDVQAAAEAGEIAYQQADFPTKLKMKADRDKALELVESVRRGVVEGAIVLTQAGVDEMGAIRKEISTAAENQARAIALGKFAVALGRHLV